MMKSNNNRISIARELPPEITALAARGGRMFPVEAKGKQPLIKEWQKNASADPSQLAAWAADFPSCNWGMATGKDSGHFVIDVDGSEGRGALAKLAEQGSTLPPTLTVTTGRADGDEHRYYRMPAGIDIRNDQSGRVAKHIDVRGTGGFVVVPSSVHASGRRYGFVKSDEPIADAPAWVVERLTTRQDKPVIVAGDGVIGPGARTPLLVSLAGKMHSQGIPAVGIDDNAALVAIRLCDMGVVSHR